MTLIFCFVFIICYHLVSSSNPDSRNPNGYILYCPCMGRFGNQVDHFLGVLAFARGLNRTLVLPPWVEYIPGISKSQQVPFNKYFEVEPLKEYHDVLEMDVFMRELSPSVWPPDQRIALCYMARYNSTGCSPKEGSPFGPFWDTFDVEFSGSEFYGPLNYDVHHHDMGRKWKIEYPPDKWPVLAFTGAPAAFPVQLENVMLQKFLVFNKDVASQASKLISSFPKGPFVAIHLRNGVDWVRACEHIDQSPALFAGPQCLGYRGQHGPASRELCLPSEDTILKQLKRTIRTISAKSVFVATDNDPMMPFLTENLSQMKVKVIKMDKPELHVELAVMGLANHFIGNCISSFTAFAKRARDVRGFPSTFWAFPIQKRRHQPHHMEL